MISNNGYLHGVQPFLFVGIVISRSEIKIKAVTFCTSRASPQNEYQLQNISINIDTAVILPISDMSHTYFTAVCGNEHFVIVTNQLISKCPVPHPTFVDNKHLDSIAYQFYGYYSTYS